ncbi:glycosyltransferase family 2 protein [Mucilaginibacter corticis]|uniref:Glycosyltransferase family 2 protein n=1 Tax=Mucilaginibacter corticis TaxID=2597670 RepID=A0A556M4Z9_9SPHI|nr:glycosyltransferase family 2 protein [Mucilaginibacter corticis]TSJ34926.1 glycosyltransferase family 2 protein [Mucilaginibacter corticis]
MKKKLSIVIPAFNEERNICQIVLEISKALNETGYLFEFIFINDGSFDNTLNEIKLQSKKYDNIFYIDLSRNFGKDYALKAGINLAKGDAIITIDADLQHPASLLPKMLQYWETGYEIVYTYRDKPNPYTNILSRISSALFYKIISIVSDNTLENGLSDFRLVDKKVADELVKINEYEFFFRGMIKWIGYSQIGIPYTPSARLTGTPAYSSFKLIKLAIGSIMAFSVKPLYLATGIGLVFSLLALFYIPYILISYFCGYDALSGWASLIATVAFFGGLQLLVLGIIGSYLGSIFLQTKNRPNYIIRSTNLIQIENDPVEF